MAFEPAKCLLMYFLCLVQFLYEEDVEKIQLNHLIHDIFVLSLHVFVLSPPVRGWRKGALDVTKGFLPVHSWRKTVTST